MSFLLIKRMFEIKVHTSFSVYPGAKEGLSSMVSRQPPLIPSSPQVPAQHTTSSELPSPTFDSFLYQHGCSPLVGFQITTARDHLISLKGLKRCKDVPALADEDHSACSRLIRRGMQALNCIAKKLINKSTIRRALTYLRT
jgi:hypothetical protein